jgi:hypothetical protein
MSKKVSNLNQLVTNHATKLVQEATDESQQLLEQFFYLFFVGLAVLGLLWRSVRELVAP